MGLLREIMKCIIPVGITLALGATLSGMVIYMAILNEPCAPCWNGITILAFINAGMIILDIASIALYAAFECSSKSAGSTPTAVAPVVAWDGNSSPLAYNSPLSGRHGV